MEARWYLPGLGRFASADSIVPDPTNPQSFNRYSYVRNNPLNLVDPSGHADCPADGPCDPPPSNDSSSSSGSNSSSQTPPAGVGGYQQPEPDDWGPPIAGSFFVSGPHLEGGEVVAVDLAGSLETELLAMGDGVVVATGFIEDAEGNFIIIEYIWDDLPPDVQANLMNTYPDLNFGPGKSIYVQYQHMKSTALLSPGDSVSAGTFVGYQGASGKTTLPSPEGDHLHMEVRAGESGSFFVEDFIYDNTSGDYWYNRWDALSVIDPYVILNFQ